MNRSKLYDGLSEIERDQIAKELTKITKQVATYSLSNYKAYALGIEAEKLHQRAIDDLIKWDIYNRLNIFIIDWLDNITRKDLGLN